jgi:hypothetical protein
MSREPAFLGAAEALIARVGEQAGCAPEDARRLGQAVRRALGGLISESEGDQFDVAFTATSRVARVDVSSQGVPANGQPSLQDTLSTSGDAAAMGRLVDRVEFGREGDREYCRLTQQVRAR